MQITARLKRSGLSFSVLLIVSILAAMHFFALPHMGDPLVEQAKTGKRYMLPLPILQFTPFSLHIPIDYHPPQQTVFRIYPGACLKSIILNKKIIPLPKTGSCNLSSGFLLDLKPYLQAGANELLLETKTMGWIELGPHIFEDGSLSAWLGYALCGAIMLLLICLMQRMTGGWLGGCILALGVPVYCYYFARTGFIEHMMDMPAHLDYIFYVAVFKVWPPIHRGWEFYHPPLYYTLQAGVMLLARRLGSFDVMSIMRSFSFCCFLVFQVFSALCLRRLIASNAGYAAALLLLVFYPTSILFPFRIDSNLLFYGFYAAGAYFLLRWVEEPRPRHLRLTLMMLGLGLASRSNALILIPLIGIACLSHWRNPGIVRAHLRSPAFWTGTIMLLAGCAANFGRTIYYQYHDGQVGHLIVANAWWFFTHVPQIRIQNSLTNLLLPNLKDYFNNPYLNVWLDSSGRQYFWNSMLKTSLFGEFYFPQKELAQFLEFLLLELIAYVASVSFFMPRIGERTAQWRIALLGLLVPIAALMLNRIQYPFGPSQDFRYIYPCLAAFCGLYGLAVERLMIKQRYSLALIGLVFAASFAAGGILFYSI